MSKPRSLALAAGILLLAAACGATPSDGGASVVQPSPVDSSPSVVSASPPVTAEPAPEPEPEPAPEPPPVDCAISACVALTYDDGPSPVTNQLLDALEARGVVATFFLNGPYATNDPATVLRAAELGMEIGNHTSNHPLLTQQSPEQITFEISDTQERIHAITGQYPTLLRPPHGDYNAQVNAIAGQLGLAVVNWTDGPADWENQDAATVTQLALARTRPGAIILMHDTHQWTVDASPAIVDGLLAQGYELVTVSQIIGDPVPGQFYYDGQAPA